MIEERFWRTGLVIYQGIPIGDAIELTAEEFDTYRLAELVEQARAKRDNLLKEVVDSVNPMRWELFTEEQKQAWRVYRQSLLDIPQQEGFPINIVWPETPY